MQNVTNVRTDPELALPAAASPPPHLGTVEPELALAGVVAVRPFLVEGGAVAVFGAERGGPVSVDIGGATVASEIDTNVGPAVNLVASPGLLRRERVGTHGSVIETLLASPSLPLAAIQWTVPPGAHVNGPIEVRLTLAPGAGEIRYRAGPTGLAVVDDTRPDEVIVAVLHPAPTNWTVDAAPSGGVRVQVAGEGRDDVTLLLASGSPERVRAALRASAHLDAQERSAHRDAAGQGMRVRSGVPELDEGVGWARARLASSLVRRGRRTPAPDRVFWSALGALAVGDGESASRGLSLLERPSTEPAPSPSADGPLLPPGPLAPFVAARIALTLGDAGPARRWAGVLDPGHLEHLRERSDEATWALWSFTLELLADALRHGWSETDIQRLRDAATLPPGGASGRVRLPMVGGRDTAGPGPASLLRTLLRRGPPLETTAVVGGEDPRALAAWALLACGETDRGYALWRSELSAGLEGRSGPLGSWDGTEARSSPGAPAAGALLGGLTHGLLGFLPDAPAGRAELFPSLPSHFERFDVAGLALGDTRFDLSYRRRARVVAYTVTPTRGRVPASLVLAPTLPGTRVDAARVDGAPAELDWESRGSRVRIQVQMPLDQVRVLEVETR